MATKLTVTTEVGTFSRRTERPYQFIIVGSDKAESREAHRQSRLDYQVYRRDRLRTILAAGQNPQDRYDWAVKSTAQNIADGSYVRELAEAEAKIAAIEAEGAITVDSGFGLLGWSAALHNARGAQRAAQKRGYYREVRIYALDGTRVV